jgi:hypothetical protein
MEMGSIPWTAKIQYVDRYKLDDFEEEMLEYCIALLDKILREKKS